MTIIGIDNGVSGSIAILHEDKEAEYYPTPVFEELNYTKEKQKINRINRAALTALLLPVQDKLPVVVVERPMVNPGRFKATISAIRALEATQGVLEDLGLPYEFIDSKTWQRAIFPSGEYKGPELKKASKQMGTWLFPHLKAKIKDDADALLIAEYKKRQLLKKL